MAKKYVKYLKLKKRKGKIDKVTIVDINYNRHEFFVKIIDTLLDNKFSIESSNSKEYEEFWNGFINDEIDRKTIFPDEDVYNVLKKIGYKA